MEENRLSESGPVKISVLTVCYNSERTIEDTIRSVRDQTYKDVEHVIVDGASTDGTMRVVTRYRDCLAQVISEPDRGIYDAMNKGVLLATGDVVGTLNADDIYADETVLEQVAAIFSDPAVDACYADLVYVSADDPTKVRRYWRSCPYRAGLFERGWMPAHPTFFVRRRVYEEHGLFDTQFKLQSDFELTMRFINVQRIKTVYTPRIWVRMRMGGVSNRSIRNVMRGNIEAYKACKKQGIKVSPLFFLMKIASRIPQFFTRPPAGSDPA
jgi:glycosyltransferase involved in cell wall biosynthesis